MKRLKEIKIGRRVGVAFYYLFIIITVGMFLLFIPLRSKLLHSGDENITKRDTNAGLTGEREVVLVSEPEKFTGSVKWIESIVKSQPHKD
jgi:hypothetical protein